MDPRKRFHQLQKQIMAKKANAYAKNPQMIASRVQPSINTRYTLKGDRNMPDYQNTKNALFKQIQSLETRCKQANDQYKTYDRLVKEVQKDLSGGHINNDSARAMQFNLGLLNKSVMMPGNVGDINQVIWPFWFTARDPNDETLIIPPDTNLVSSFTVTQEAAFVIMEFTKQVFIEDDQNPGQFVFIDPAQADGSAKANNLSYTMKDSQSSRVFNDQPTDINSVGYWEWPTVMGPPMLLLPNSNFELDIANDDPNNTYAVMFTFFGYRIRIDKAKDILSTIVG